MNDKIKEAIARGEAQQAEVKRLKQLELEKELQAERERKQRYMEAARVWAREQLPGIIETETAKGNRHYITRDEDEANAAKELGLAVNAQWQERCMDEGFDWGSYWSYTISW